MEEQEQKVNPFKGNGTWNIVERIERMIELTNNNDDLKISVSVLKKWLNQICDMKDCAMHQWEILEWYKNKYGENK